MGSEREGRVFEPGADPHEVVSLFDAVAVALVLHRPDGSIAVATQSAADMFGVRPPDLEGITFGREGPRFEAADGTVLQADELPCLQALSTGKTAAALVHYRAADGSERWLDVESKPLTDLTGGPYAVATTLTDVTRQREREARLSHDEVTGLGSRVLALEHLRRAIARADRRRAAVIVMFVDLDDFKSVNDSFGHATGDLVLRTFAGRLRGVVRTSDFVGRMGGDEFLVVAGDFEGDADGTQSAAEAATDAACVIARRITAALDNPLSEGGNTHPLGASMGVAIYPDHGMDIDGVLRSADTAMYDAKAAGRGCFRFYVPPGTPATG